MQIIFSFYRVFTAHFLLFIITLLFIVASVYLYHGFSPDDTFIHIGFAKDISEGKGFSFAGNPTYGSTAPLWPPMIAALGSICGDFEIAAKVLSLSFSIISVAFIYFVSRLRFNNLISLSISTIFCFNAYFLRWSLTGMEAAASCFFMLVLVYILFKEIDNSAQLVFYFIAGFAPLIRPEFYLFTPTLFFSLLLRYPIYKRWFKAAILLAPVIVWNLFALFYFGTIVPSTFLIKAGSNLFSTEIDTVVRSFKLFLSSNPIEIFASIASILLISINWKKRGVKFPQFIRSEWMLLIAWIVLFYSYYILKNVTILSRYSLVLLPIIIIITFKFLTVTFTNYNISKHLTNLLILTFVVMSLLVNGFYTFVIVKPDADSFINGFQREYKKIAAILADEANNDASVALSDVGIIGACSNMKIYDFVGLVDKDRFKFSSKKEYFLNKKPKYLILRGEMELRDIQDSSTSFQQIYTTQISGLGINQQKLYNIFVYRVLWNQ